MKHNHLDKSSFKWAKRVNYYIVIDELITHEGDWSDNRTHIFKHHRDARVYARYQAAITGRKMEIRIDRVSVPAWR